MAVQANNNGLAYLVIRNEAHPRATNPINYIEPSALGIILSPLNSLKRRIPYINVDTKKTDYKEGLVAELTPINVIFNPPATIVFWEDGEKTVVKCGEGEVFDKEKRFGYGILQTCMGQ